MRTHQNCPECGHIEPMHRHSRYMCRLRSLVVSADSHHSRLRSRRLNAVTGARTIRRPIDSCHCRMPPAPIRVYYWPSQQNFKCFPLISSEHLHKFRRGVSPCGWRFFCLAAGFFQLINIPHAHTHSLYFACWCRLCRWAPLLRLLLSRVLARVVFVSSSCVNSAEISHVAIAHIEPHHTK